MENNIHEDGDFALSTKIIPSKRVLANHKQKLEQLLLAISKREGISVKDAAVAVTNVLRNVISTKDLK